MICFSFDGFFVFLCKVKQQYPWQLLLSNKISSKKTVRWLRYHGYEKLTPLHSLERS